MASSGDEKGYTYSKLVRINSGSAYTKDTPGYSDSNFIINLGQSLQNIWRVSILNVIFTNSAYNIRQKSTASPNATFSWTTANSGGTVFHTIAEGFYNNAQLISAMTTAVNTVLTSFGAGQSISITQDPISQRNILAYTAGTSGAPSFTLVPNTSGSDSTWLNLGFSVTSSNVATSTLIAPNVPNLVGLRQVFLQSSTLSPGNQIDEKGTWQNVLINIPVTAPFGAVNVFECKVDSLCMIEYQSKRNLNVIDFQLVDDKGNIIELNGTTVKIELRMWTDTI